MRCRETVRSLLGAQPWHNTAALTLLLTAVLSPEEPRHGSARLSGGGHVASGDIERQ